MSSEKALYHESLKYVPVGLFIIDEAKKICVWNDWLSKNMKISEDEAKGKSIYDLFPEVKDNNRFELGLNQIFDFSCPQFFSHSLHQSIFNIETDKKTYQEFDFIQQDVTLYPLVINDKKYAVVTVLDQTAFAHLKLTLMKMGHKFERLSLIDPMTRLFNRRCLYEHLCSAFEHAKKYPNKIMCCALFDLDHFKSINDTLGHHAGDEVIQSFSKLLLATASKRDYAFRLGGEEFALIYFVKEEKDIPKLAKKVREKFSQLDTHGDVKRVVTCSSGVSFWHSKMADVSSDVIIQQADKALYTAKENGRNQLQIHTP